MPAVRTLLRDLVDTAAGIGSLHAFSSAIVAAGLVSRLRSSGPFTVFVPTDDAFARLAEHTLEDLLRPKNRSDLLEILTYHMLPGKRLAREVIKSSSAWTVQGAGMTVRFTEGRMHVNNAEVIRADIECTNGVMHLIDTVMIPR